MNIDGFDLEQKVMIVAEIGNNHEGSVSLAEELVGLAAEAGADAVKFQTIVPEKLVSIQQSERIAQLRRFQFSYEQFAALAEKATKAGLLFLSTPFDLDSVDYLAPYVPAFKIASGDNTFYPLLKKVAASGKPVILSCGLAEMEQIRFSVDYIKKFWLENNVRQEIAVLHCVTSYPVPPEQASLLTIKNLQEATGCTVGYSDHTVGTLAALAAVGLGARIIEKHFTIDKNYSSFRDHQLSSDPAEFKAIVDQVRIIETMLKPGDRKVQSCEGESLVAARRSIVAARDLAAGETICWEDISWVRPGDGLAPGNECLLLGRRLNRPVASGEKILLEALTPMLY